MLNNDVVELYFVVVALDIVKIVFCLCTSYEISNGCVSILFIFIINIGSS